MTQTQAFWKKVREVEATIQSDVVWIISITNHDKGTIAGAACQADRFTAARAIVELTHKLAEPEEVEAHEREQKRKAAENARIEQGIQKRKILVLRMGPTGPTA